MCSLSHQRPARKTIHLFSGMAYCSCGQKMYVPSNSPKYTCSKCRNKMALDDLEDIFQHQLKDFFLSPSEVNTYLNRADEAIKEKEELLEALSEEQRRVSQDMEKVYRLYLDDQITPEGFGGRYKPMEERLGQIEDQIPQLQAEVDFLRIQFLSSDQVLTEAQDLYSRWEDLSSDEKRKIVESITERIIVGEGEVTIHLAYLPSSSETMAEGQRTPSVASETHGVSRSK